MVRNISLLLILLGASLASFANECDCEEGDAMIDKYHEFISITQFDSTVYYLEQIGKIRTADCQAIYYNYAGFLAFRKNDFERGKILVHKSINILKSSDCDIRALQGPYNTMGLIFSDTDMLDSAAFYVLKAIEIAEEVGDKNGMTRNYTVLAGIFGKMNQIENAILYVKKSIIINTERKAYLDLSSNYNLLATAFSVWAGDPQKINYTDSVDFALDQAYHYSILSENLILIPNIYGNKGENFKIKKDYVSAQAYLDSAISFAVEGFHERNKPYWYIKKALITIETFEFNEGFQYCDSAMKYAKMTSSIYALKDVYMVQYQLYKAKGDFQNALLAYEAASTMDDSLNLSENTAIINELEKKYDQVKNEKTIGELEQQKEIYKQQKEIQDLRITQLFFGIVLLIVLLFFGAYLFWQSNKNKKRKLLDIEQRLNRARMNPHFVFNVLAALQSLTLDEKRKHEVSVYISRFSKIMRQSLESTFTEFTTLEEEIEFLTNYMELQKLLNANRFTYSIDIDNTIDAFDVKIPGMIVQPFIENSIDHGFRGYENGGKIQLIVKKTSENLVIQIEDNGKSVSVLKENKQYPSRATQIIADRLFLLKKKTGKKANYKLTHTESGGILVEIFLPLLYSE